MATTYYDPAWDVFALQDRTDKDGDELTDVSGEDARLPLTMFSGGIVSPTDGFLVRQRAAGANMSVDVGSGNADTDVAIVEGRVSGQGNYIVRLSPSSVNLTVPAADLANSRIDQVYLVVEDDAYDSSGKTLPRLAYRDGTPSSSPQAPGPDSSWTAYLLLATIHVEASATSITNDDIVDERPFSLPVAASGGYVPVGAVLPFAGTVPPAGYLLADGSAKSRTTYARLFAVIGTTYGAGDGSTTFNLPDLRQRFPLGKAASGTGSALGETGGQIDHVHTGPAHTHSMSHTHTVNPPSTATSSAGAHTHSIGNTGSAGSHSHSISGNTNTAGSHRHTLLLDGEVGAHFHVFGDAPGVNLNSRHDAQPANRMSTDGAHSHTVSGTTSTTGAHTHSVPNTNSAGAHTHNVDIPAFTSGASSISNTGSSGTGNTGSANPPYIVLNYIIKT